MLLSKAKSALPWLSARPVTARAFSRLWRGDLRHAAERVIEISPPTIRDTRPAVCLPGELDRVIRHEPNPVINLQRMLDPRVEHDGTAAFLLRDVIVADSTLLGGRAYQVLRPADRRWVLRGRPPPINEGMLCTDWVVEQYFGHWMVDGLARELLASDRKVMPLVLEGPARLHEAGYRELTGLAAHSISYAHADRLWIVEDSGLNDGKVARIQRVRSRLREAVPAGKATRVFLLRGLSGQGRHLTNEAELADALSSRGFDILCPETETAAHVAKSLRSASIMVSVEGSNIAHGGLALPTGAGLLVIQPPDRFNTVWKTRADALGLQFAYTVGTASSTGGFVQPLDRLLRTLDLLESAIG
jgi:hypothetical protein